jgi:biopolymer transport protein ExbD
MTKPHINVTPLIDVLLVLLIIFMVVSPLKPESFKARVPRDRSDAPIDPQTLVVIIGKDSSLTLNTETDLGTAADTEPLIARLRSIFNQRIANKAASQQPTTDPERPFSDSIERTVFIKAPRRLDYGSVARVVDAVKLAGAYPIGLQIDDLE